MSKHEENLRYAVTALRKYEYKSWSDSQTDPDYIEAAADYMAELEAERDSLRAVVAQVKEWHDKAALGDVCVTFGKLAAILGGK